MCADKRITAGQSGESFFRAGHGTSWDATEPKTDGGLNALPLSAIAATGPSFLTDPIEARWH